MTEKKLRYSMWAGIGSIKQLEWLLDFKTEKDEPFPCEIWGITDDETCGSIDGQPRLDQYCCICFTATEQRKVWAKLNNIKE